MPWWEEFDWTPELGITDPYRRAAVLADMFADDEEEMQRYYDEILATLLAQANRLN
jgi:hypothetical protein